MKIDTIKFLQQNGQIFKNMPIFQGFEWAEKLDFLAIFWKFSPLEGAKDDGFRISIILHG